MTDGEQGRNEYERTFLTELRKLLLDPKIQAQREQDNPPVRVEDVRIETSTEGGAAVILFRDLNRPECLFGYAWDHLETMAEAAEIDTTIAWANWEEEIYTAGYGLPQECSPEGINWI